MYRFAIFALLILILKKGIDRIKKQKVVHRNSDVELESAKKRLSKLNEDASKRASKCMQIRNSVCEKGDMEFQSRDSTVYSLAEEGVVGEVIENESESGRDGNNRMTNRGSQVSEVQKPETARDLGR